MTEEGAVSGERAAVSIAASSWESRRTCGRREWPGIGQWRRERSLAFCWMAWRRQGKLGRLFVAMTVTWIGMAAAEGH